jgi:hypothetical protein
MVSEYDNCIGDAAEQEHGADAQERAAHARRWADKEDSTT